MAVIKAMSAKGAIMALLSLGVFVASLAAQNAAPVVAAPQDLVQAAHEATQTRQESPQARLPLPKGSVLRYHVKMRMRGEDASIETNFLLRPTPARRSNNRVQKPRLGGWRLEADLAAGIPSAQTMLLARAERLMYFSGPSPSLELEPSGLRFGGKRYPVWKVPVPANVQCYASLLEVSKNTLVLCEATVKFTTGEVATLEVRLEAFNLKAGMAPPEDGTALLSTLQQWSRAPLEGAGHLDDGTTETQKVD